MFLGKNTPSEIMLKRIREILFKSDSVASSSTPDERLLLVAASGATAAELLHELTAWCESKGVSLVAEPVDPEVD